LGCRIVATFVVLVTMASALIDKNAPKNKKPATSCDLLVSGLLNPICG
jgi:hypothetical protein